MSPYPKPLAKNDPNDGKDKNVFLLPIGDRLDEVRRAFTKWTFENHDRRTEPAAVDLREAIMAAFGCR